MTDLRSLEIFVRVAERLSFVGAARDLGISQSGVSNAIARLEQRLGVRLLARTTRRVNLTEDGAAYFERCRLVLSNLEEAELVLRKAGTEPVGRLHVDMPVAFGRLKVVPRLGAFQARYPEIELVLTFRDRYIDLVEEGVDIAVRFGPLPDSTLIARRFAETRFQVVASPAYLARAGRPRVIEDLKRHTCLVLAQRGGPPREWRFRRRKRDIRLPPPWRMSFSDGAAICAAACAGYGIAQMHDYYTDGPIAAGELEPVLEHFRAGADAISLVYPQTRHLSPKVRAFIDFMTAKT